MLRPRDVFAAVGEIATQEEERAPRLLGWLRDRAATLQLRELEAPGNVALDLTPPELEVEDLLAGHRATYVVALKLWTLSKGEEHPELCAAVALIFGRVHAELDARLLRLRVEEHPELVGPLLTGPGEAS